MCIRESIELDINVSLNYCFLFAVSLQKLLLHFLQILCIRSNVETLRKNHISGQKNDNLFNIFNHKFHL